MPQRTHGKTGSRAYYAWSAMVQRCTNRNNPRFKDYGGRGVSLCWRWLMFANFYSDMGDPPAGMTLERKNNAKGYSKRNCAWVTRKAQQRNRRVNCWFTFRGQRMLLRDVAALSGVPLSTLYKRVHAAGMSLEAAVTTTRIKPARVTKLTEERVKAIKLRLKEQKRGLGMILALEHGVSPQLICGIKKGRAWAHVQVPA